MNAESDIVLPIQSVCPSVQCRYCITRMDISSKFLTIWWGRHPSFFSFF